MHQQEENGQFYDYPENRGGSNGRTSQPANIGNIAPIILLGVVIAVFENFAKWKSTMTNYLLRLADHPKEIFRFETLVYLFVAFLLIKIAIWSLKKIL